MEFSMALNHQSLNIIQHMTVTRIPSTLSIKKLWSWYLSHHPIFVTMPTLSYALPHRLKQPVGEGYKKIWENWSLPTIPQRYPPHPPPESRHPSHHHHVHQMVTHFFRFSRVHHWLELKNHLVLFDNMSCNLSAPGLQTLVGKGFKAKPSNVVSCCLIKKNDEIMIWALLINTYFSPC